MAGSLSGSGLTPCRYDANLDFYREHLFSVCETSGEIKKLAGNKFYDPHSFISCKHKINTSLASVAYPLSDFQRGGDSNPFARLCEQGLEIKLSQHNPGTIIFFVSSQNQAVAA